MLLSLVLYVIPLLVNFQPSLGAGNRPVISSYFSAKAEKLAEIQRFPQHQPRVMIEGGVGTGLIL